MPPNLPNKLDPSYEEALINKAVEKMFEVALAKFEFQIKVLSWLSSVVKWTFMLGGIIYLGIKNRSIFQW